MRTKHLCVLIHIRIKGEIGTVKHVKPFSEKFLLRPYQGNASFVDPSYYLCFIFVLVLLSCLFCVALWPLLGKC